MRPRTFVFITMMALCHWMVRGQVLTNALPPAQNAPWPQNSSETSPPGGQGPGLPDDPGQEALPIAQPEPIPRGGVPVRWKADRQTWAGHTAILYGVEEFHYRDYVLRADKVVYNQETS